MNQYVVRYKIENENKTRMIIIDAKTVKECKIKALTWICKAHNVEEAYSRDKVLLDVTSAYNPLHDY